MKTELFRTCPESGTAISQASGIADTGQRGTRGGDAADRWPISALAGHTDTLAGCTLASSGQVLPTADLSMALTC